MKNLLEKMAKEGGIIVSSASLTPLEIAQAQSCDRFYVDENSLGFALIPENYKVVRAASHLIQDIDIILDYAVSDKEKISMIKPALGKAYSQITDESPAPDGWVSVEDELPSEHRRFLCIMFSINCFVEEVCLFEYSTKKWMFQNKYVTVTHYQPLPQPPKQ